jgi:hypothetical protein
MDELTFSKVAPVTPVRDLKWVLRRYRMLGFAARMDHRDTAIARSAHEAAKTLLDAAL